MVDISVIIVSYNSKDILKECMTFIVNHKTSYSTEIILVDNASSDGAADIIEHEFNNVRIIRNNENLGFGKANNIGMLHSSGRYICLINSDAYPLKNCFDKLCQFMDRNPDVGICGPKLLFADGRLQPNCREFPTVWNNICRSLALDRIFPKYSFFSGQEMFFFPHNIQKDVDMISGAFLMIRKSALDDVGMFDEDFFFYGEDKDLCKRFRMNNWRIVFLPEAKAVHYGGASTVDIFEYYKKQMEAKLIFYRKHYQKPKKSILLYTEFLFLTLRYFSKFFLSLFPFHQTEKTSDDISKLSQCIKWYSEHYKNYK